MASQNCYSGKHNLVNTWEAFSSIRCCFSLKEALNSKWPLPPFTTWFSAIRFSSLTVTLDTLTITFIQRIADFSGDPLSHRSMRIRVRCFSIALAPRMPEEMWYELHTWEHLRHRKPSRFNRVPFHCAKILSVVEMSLFLTKTSTLVFYKIVFERTICSSKRCCNSSKLFTC